MTQSLTEVAGLKPCPFCGASSIQVFEADDIGGWLAGCCAQTWGDTEAEAIAAWNTRSQPTLTEAPEPLVERVARAIWIDAGFKPSIWDKTEGAEWAQYMDDKRPKWLGYAHAAIAALIEREKGSNHG